MIFDRNFELALTAGYNDFNFPNYTNTGGVNNNPKLHHWLLAVEGRYRFTTKRGQNLYGNFIALNVFGGQYNIGGIRLLPFLRNHRYEGWFNGIGVRYGYRLRISDRWSVEPSIGADWIQINYNKYECGNCGKLRKRGNHDYAIPHVSVTFTYLISKNSVINTLPEYRPSVGQEMTTVENIDKSEIISIHSLSEKINTDSVHINENTLSITTRADTLHLTFRYPVDSSEFMREYAENSEHLTLIDSLLSRINLDRIESVRVTGYASPEYTTSHNRHLSEERAFALARYVMLTYGLNPLVSAQGEDWNGLYKAIHEGKCDLTPAVREEILQILGTPSTPEWRRKRMLSLENTGVYHRILRDLYPLLRRTELLIIYSSN